MVWGVRSGEVPDPLAGRIMGSMTRWQVNCLKKDPPVGRLTEGMQNAK